MTDRTNVVARFRALTRSGSIDLWEGALLIAELVDPGEDLPAASERIGRLAQRVAAAGRPSHEMLVRVLFAEEGFAGDAKSYDDPANSSVARVLAKKTGMPITLSIVTMEVGRRAGLELTGVGLPGHFVVGGEDLPKGLFLDPFDGGRLLDADALTKRVAAALGVPVSLPAEAFAADSARAILLRVLLNLRRSWERRERHEEALAAVDCATCLAPEDATLRRERGLLLLRAGHSEPALVELEAYVGIAEGEDAQAVTKLIAAVRRGLDRPPGEPAGSVAVKKTFTLQEARHALPRVQRMTSDAVARYAQLAQGGESEEERQSIVHDWVAQVSSLGAEIKGLWLVDFDSGAGYYCWKFPEPALEYFHGYEEGFAGRLPLQ